MTQSEIIQHWLDSAKEDWQVVNDLFATKHYGYCLFFCHLIVEKYLKALVIQVTDQSPPITHDLKQLALLAKLVVSEEQKSQLSEINTFNVEARYDTEKQKLYKKATPAFTQEYLRITEELFLWIKQHIQL